MNEVVEESPAEKAGLKAGDVIVKVEQEKIEETDDLVNTIRESDAGDEVTVKIIRNGKRETLSATLESREIDRGPSIAWFHGDDDEDVEMFHMPNLSVQNETPLREQRRLQTTERQRHPHFKPHPLQYPLKVRRCLGIGVPALVEG